MPRTTRRVDQSLGIRVTTSAGPSVTVWLLIATALCTVAAPRVVHAGRPQWQEQYVIRWKKQMREIDGLLLARGWKEANREAERLLTEMTREVKAGGGQLLGGALTERSAALAGLGKMHDAEWYAGMAELFWSHTADQLGRYGEAGQRLRKALLGCEQRVKRIESAEIDERKGGTAMSPSPDKAGRSHQPGEVGRDLDGKRIKAPAIRTKIPTRYPEGVQAGRGEDKVAVGALVDVRGVPQCPTIERGSPYVPLVYSVLDALKDWRFKPATTDGKPVEVQYVLRARFILPR